MGMIDDFKAWVTEVDPNDSSKSIQKLRVFLDNFTAEFSPSGLKNEGRHSEITVNDSSWTALPSSALGDRNAMAIQNNSTVSNVKVNYDNTVPTYTGMTIRKNGGERQYDIKETIVIYAKAETGTVTLDIEELS